MFDSKKQLSPAEAKAEVNRPFDLEKDLTEKRRKKVAGISDVQNGAARSVLAGESVEVSAQKVVAAQAEIHTIETAIGVARQRRVDAVKNLYRTEADALRAAAKAKRDEASDIQRKAAHLLAKLSALELPEGTAYDHTILGCQPTGAWPGVLKPRSKALTEEAGRLDNQAEELERREVPVSARLTLKKATIDALFQDEVFHDSGYFAPATFQVESWAEAVEGKVRHERPDLIRVKNRQYEIVWRGTELDTTDSTLRFPVSFLGSGDTVFTAEVPA
jgi:hypothetical protein